MPNRLPFYTLLSAVFCGTCLPLSILFWCQRGMSPMPWNVKACLCGAVFVVTLIVSGGAQFLFTRESWSVCRQNIARLLPEYGGGNGRGGGQGTFCVERIPVVWLGFLLAGSGCHCCQTLQHGEPGVVCIPLSVGRGCTTGPRYQLFLMSCNYSLRHRAACACHVWGPTLKREGSLFEPLGMSLRYQPFSGL